MFLRERARDDVIEWREIEHVVENTQPLKKFAHFLNFHHFIGETHHNT